MNVLDCTSDKLQARFWILLWCILALDQVFCTELWKEWWGYDGHSGPQFWGKHIEKWALCRTGKYQSPIDIDPERLIYDPNLTTIKYNATKANGTLFNTGLDLTIEFNETDPGSYIRFSGGPFSYTYRVYNVKLHFGVIDNNGSEHMIAGKQFPLELQIMGFNEDLYKDNTEATMSTHGLAIIAVLGADYAALTFRSFDNQPDSCMHIDDVANPEFERLLSAVRAMSYQGGGQAIKDFSILSIIPPSELYITYEGSLTQPSCQETVTWAIVNKPLRVTKQQMKSLRALYHYNENRTTLASNNFRPPLPVNRRPVRTNIHPYAESEYCAIKIKKSYRDIGATSTSIRVVM